MTSKVERPDSHEYSKNSVYFETNLEQYAPENLGFSCNFRKTPIFVADRSYKLSSQRIVIGSTTRQSPNPTWT